MAKMRAAVSQVWSRPKANAGTRAGIAARVVPSGPSHPAGGAFECSPTQPVPRAPAFVIGLVLTLGLAPVGIASAAVPPMPPDARFEGGGQPPPLPRLNAEQRAEVDAVWRRIEALSPEQRRMLELRMRLQRMSPEERAALKQRLERFRSLSPEQQRELRERWREMSPEERLQFEPPP